MLSLRNQSIWNKTNKIGKRLSTQALQNQASDPENQITKLDNGLTVVSTAHGDRAARVSLLVKGGSRYENGANAGITHTLRACTGLTSSKNGVLMTTQMIAQIGGSFNASSSKEHLMYNVACGSGIAPGILSDVLAPAVFENLFPWYEIDELKQVMKYQNALANADMGYTIMEAAHKASFSGGLSNPLLSHDDMIGKHTSDMLKNYVDSVFSLKNMVLAASGIDHKTLCQLGSAFAAPSQEASVLDNASFIASEYREHRARAGNISAALSFEGVPLNSNDAIALAVLQEALGTGSHIKRGSSLAQGKISSAIKCDSNFEASAYNVNYSDAGLFGVGFTVDKENAVDVMEAVNSTCKAIATGGLTDQEINTSKSRLSAHISMSAESKDAVVEDMAIQASSLGTYIPASEIVSKINQISPSQVNRVAKKVLGGKKSLAVIGEISKFPHLSNL